LTEVTALGRNVELLVGELAGHLTLKEARDEVFSGALATLPHGHSLWLGLTRWGERMFSVLLNRSQLRPTRLASRKDYSVWRVASAV
jgi:hypothetical protein